MDLTPGVDAQGVWRTLNDFFFLLFFWCTHCFSLRHVYTTIPGNYYQKELLEFSVGPFSHALLANRFHGEVMVTTQDCTKQEMKRNAQVQAIFIYSVSFAIHSPLSAVELNLLVMLDIMSIIYISKVFIFSQQITQVTRIETELLHLPDTRITKYKHICLFFFIFIFFKCRGSLPQ